ncbi:MAG: cupin domain-containing protein [bacterium]
MATLIRQPTLVQAVGTKPKKIEEFIGRVNTGTAGLSIARMRSPEGWEEPGQTPEFDEFTIVLNGTLLVETSKETIHVSAGQAVITQRGEWVRYSTPSEGGAEYLAVCRPAFSPATVHRDSD